MSRKIYLSLFALIGGMCIYSSVNISADSYYSDNAPSNNPNDDEETQRLRNLIIQMKKVNANGSASDTNAPSQQTGTRPESDQSNYSNGTEANPPSANQYKATYNNEAPAHSNYRPPEYRPYNPGQSFNEQPYSPNYAPEPLAAYPQSTGYPVYDGEGTVDHDYGFGSPDYYWNKPRRYASEVGLELLWLSHIEGRGIGYRRGYTTIGAFFEPCQLRTCGLQPFLDVRGHYFNDGKWAANVGVGTRWWDECLQRTFGVNVFYDYRRGDSFDCKETKDFNQIGFGVEMLGCLYDVRANAYFPIGDIKEETCPEYTFFPGGNCEELFSARKHRRKALAGFDAEIETRLRNWCPCSCLDLYGAVGAYFYRSDCHRDCDGGKIRVGIDFLRYFTIELRGSYDPMFKGIFQGLIQLAIPFGPDCCDCGCDCCCVPVPQPVHRKEIIVLSKKHCVWETNF